MTDRISDERLAELVRFVEFDILHCSLPASKRYVDMLVALRELQERRSHEGCKVNPNVPLRQKGNT